jgi:hypothetical protein
MAQQVASVEEGKGVGVTFTRQEQELVEQEAIASL